MPFLILFHVLFRLAPVWGCFVLGYLIFRGLAARKFLDNDWRVSFALATMLVGVAFVVLAESAGAVHQLTGPVIYALWTILDIALLATLVRVCKPTREQITAGLRENWRRFRTFFAKDVFVSPCYSVSLALAAAFMLFLGAVALLSPTTTWDTLTYHMPRVAHWIQQHSLNHYPTNLISQVCYSSGAEIQIATLMLFTGDDWPVNLPQYWGFLTSALLAAFLAERLLTWHFQWHPAKKPMDPLKLKFCGLIAAVVAMTTPYAAMQATSAMADVRSGTWTVLLAVFGALLIQSPKNYFYAAGVGAAFSLGLNNKPTMLIYAAPLAVALVVVIFRKSRRMFFMTGLVTAAFFLVLNGPWMWRNYHLFHTVVASPEIIFLHEMRKNNPAKIAANFFRNLALYANTPFDSVTQGMDEILTACIKLTGQPLQDSDSVFFASPFYYRGSSQIVVGDGFGEIMDVLPVFFAAVFFLIQFKWKSPLLFFLGLIFVGFVAFCGYVVWMPWHQRLHLPYFMLAAAFSGAVLGWVWPRWLLLATTAILVVNAVLVVLYDHFDPLVDEIPVVTKTREERYFCFRPQLYAPTAELARDIISRGVTNVLLKTGPDTWEYPLWAMLKSRGFHGTIQHAFVENESTNLPGADVNAPDTVLIEVEAKIPPQTNYPLSVSYLNWTAHYRGKPDNRIKLISNQIFMNLSAPQPGRLQVRCIPLDQNDQPITNNVIRLQIGDTARDYPTTGGPMLLEGLLKPGSNPVGIICLNPLSAGQRIMTLANVDTKLAPP